MVVMKAPESMPTLGRSILWTAIFYVCFGFIFGILSWFLNAAGSNFVFKMLEINIPVWASGWILLLIITPTFAVIGAISGAIIYWPVKALIRYLRPPEVIR